MGTLAQTLGVSTTKLQQAMQAIRPTARRRRRPPRPSREITQDPGIEDVLG